MSPRFIAKIATSLDGKIALNSGQSRWISCQSSRKIVHEMRSKFDAVLTSSTTAIADDAKLNVRLADVENVNQPIRILLDTFLETPLSLKIFDNENAGKTLVFCSKNADLVRKHTLSNANIEFFEVDSDGDALNLYQISQKLGELGINSILIEAGGRLLHGFIAARMLSQLIWFRAPIIIGNDGIAAFGNWGFHALDETIKLQLESVQKIDCDLMETYTILES